MKKLVSIITPAHNEEGIIENFVDEVIAEANLLGLDYELIIVENGSSDKTLELLKGRSVRNKKLLPFHLKTAGYGLAMLYGFKKAKGDYIVVFNVDFYDPKFLKLAEVDMLGYDIISSSKLLPGSKDRRPFSRRAVSFVYNKFLNIFLSFEGTDTHGIKLLRAKTIKPVIKSCLTTSGILDSELMIRAGRQKLKMLELPVEISEIRPARFGINRLLKTPKDIYQLWTALHES